MIERCENCGGRLDRPGLFQCNVDGHPEPTIAQTIVAAIEADLRGRRGLSGSFEDVDADVQDEIRDRWAELVREVLAHDQENQDEDDE